MRDDALYRSAGSMEELQALLEMLKPEERRAIEEEAQRSMPFQENAFTDTDIGKTLQILQKESDGAPQSITPLPFSPCYSVNNCNVNVDRYIAKEKQGTVSIGFKLYRATQEGKIVGYKAIVHFVVLLKDGKYIDPTPDEEYLFVPSSKIPKQNSEHYNHKGVRLSGVVCGEEEYKNWVNSYDTHIGLRTVHDPKDLEMLVTHKKGDPVVLKGLNAIHRNGARGILMEYDPTRERWGVKIANEGVWIKLENIQPLRPPQLMPM